MTGNRVATGIVIVGLVIFGLASSIGILGLGGALNYPAYRFRPTCQPPALPGTLVTVTLANMGMPMLPGDERGTMRVFTDQARVTVGTVSFRALNTGSLRHELVVVPLAAGHAPGDRPVGSDGRVAEADSLGEASASCAAGSGAGIAPGAMGWTSIALPPGQYELLCNLPGHYRAGMTALMTVEPGS